MNYPFLDLTGKHFGRLTVKKFLGNNKNNQRTWLVSCSCGNSKTMLTSSIKKAFSCGCIAKEKLAKYNKQRKNPWITKYPQEHHLWEGMKDRCYNPHNKKWHRYGGRGISVYSDWKNSFENFIKYLGKRPSLDYLIDRINNDGNYEPGNVRWATRTQQQRNMSSNHILEYKGEKKTISEWSILLSIPRNVLYARINQLKWSVNLALETPVISNRKDRGNFKHHGSLNWEEVKSRHIS